MKLNCVDQNNKLCVYLYRPKQHALLFVAVGDKHKLLAMAALEQSSVANAAIYYSYRKAIVRVASDYEGSGSINCR